MWRAVDFPFNDNLYYEGLVIENLHTKLLVSNETSKTVYSITFDGVPMSYRVTLESYYWCPFDGYENNDELDFRVNKVFYTQESEYLKWFLTVNENQNEQLWGEDCLYHFQIITEDTIIDIISDDFPSIKLIEGSK